MAHWLSRLSEMNSWQPEFEQLVIVLAVL